MTAGDLERFRKAEEVFYAALEMAAGPDRDRLIGDRCGRDAELQAQVALLLENDECVRAAAPPVPPPLPRFGVWQAVKLLGRGGMGTVYLADRADGAFHMSAAVKVAPLALASLDIEQRFLRERKFLARFDHPNIAHLLDGGVSESGLPYLAMEYVDGVRLDAYCDSRKLDIPARLGLFREVCDAVEYAHCNLVVHLDLKPSNILVTAEGAIKLLDFGTSKLIEPDGLLTSSLMVTPFYASPEQLRNEPVTTACDIYSLGVILFELLAGQRPSGDAPVSVVLERAHTGYDPGGPDKSVTGPAAENRGVTPGRLRALLAGDLSTIVRKCLASRPGDRYASVGALAEDVDRYLAGRPVLARAQTWLYRGARFARRNRWAIGIGAVVFAVLAVSAIYAVLQHDREQRRALQIRSVSLSNLSDIYREVSSLPGSTRARILIVNQARKNLDDLLRESPNDPALQRAGALAYAQLGAIQGAPYTVSLADSTGALASYRRAETLVAGRGGEDWEALAVLVQAREGIAQLQIRAGQGGEAIATLRSILDPARSLWNHGRAGLSPAALQLIGNSPGRLYARASLLMGFAMLTATDANTDTTGLPPAIAQLRHAIAAAEEVRARDPGMPDMAPQFSQYLGYALQGVCERSGNAACYAPAIAAHQRAVDAAKRQFEAAATPQNQRNYADALAAISWPLRLAGETARAVDSARQALLLMEPIADADPASAELHFDLGYTYFHLGAAEGSAGELPAAFRDLKKSESMILLPPLLQPSDHETVDAYVKTRDQLAIVLLRMHNRAGAIAALEEAIQAARDPAIMPRRRLEELRRKLAEARARSRSTMRSSSSSASVLELQ
jgi:serine/threonine protein kinase